MLRWIKAVCFKPQKAPHKHCGSEKGLVKDAESRESGSDYKVYMNSPSPRTIIIKEHQKTILSAVGISFIYGNESRILNMLEKTQHNDISKTGHPSTLTESRASDWVWSLNSSPAVSLASPQAVRPSSAQPKATG